MKKSHSKYRGTRIPQSFTTVTQNVKGL